MKDRNVKLGYSFLKVTEEQGANATFGDIFKVIKNSKRSKPKNVKASEMNFQYLLKKVWNILEQDHCVE